MKFVKGSGIAIESAHAKEIIEKHFSPTMLLNIGNLRLVNLSIFLRIGAVFSITVAKVFLFMDLTPIHFGSHGEFIPKINCIENINNGVDNIVVYPGGTGSGMLSGKAKSNISMAKPRSCKAVFTSNSVM